MKNIVVKPVGQASITKNGIFIQVMPDQAGHRLAEIVNGGFDFEIIDPAEEVIQTEPDIVEQEENEQGEE